MLEKHRIRTGRWMDNAYFSIPHCLHILPIWRCNDLLTTGKIFGLTAKVYGNLYSKTIAANGCNIWSILSLRCVEHANLLWLQIRTRFEDPQKYLNYSLSRITSLKGCDICSICQFVLSTPTSHPFCVPAKVLEAPISEVNQTVIYP